MLRIVGFKNCVSNEGNSFISLILQGGIEIIHSANGNLYATARKTSVACTFDEETCKGLIGTELPGKIEKVESEPYEYSIPQTGEVLVLHHRYQFVPEEKKVQFIPELIEEVKVSDLEYSQSV